MTIVEKIIDLIEKCPYCDIVSVAQHLASNGVTIQEWIPVTERLPIDDAILILREELQQLSDGYATHISYGGKGDPATEANLAALEMAISSLEQRKRYMPKPPKGE